MISPRSFLLVSSWLATVAPTTVDIDQASAKNGNGGNGGGGGNNGNGGGNGDSGRNGNAGGDGQGKGPGTGSSVRSTTSSSRREVNARTGDTVSVSGSSIQVRHRTGIEEALTEGRYVMRDKRGRTIVERAATQADWSQIQSLLD